MNEYILQPDFGCAQHPKSGQNTQKPGTWASIHSLKWTELVETFSEIPYCLN